jgi:hypothetical protein
MRQWYICDSSVNTSYLLLQQTVLSVVVVGFGAGAELLNSKQIKIFDKRLIRRHTDGTPEFALPVQLFVGQVTGSRLVSCLRFLPQYIA